MLMQHLTGTNKEYYGIFRSGLFLNFQMLFNADIWQNLKLEEVYLKKQKQAKETLTKKLKAWNKSSR